MGVAEQPEPATAGSPVVPRCRGHLRREGGKWTWNVRQQCGPHIHAASGPAESDTAASAAIIDAIRPTYRSAA